MQLLIESKAKIAEFNKTRIANVQAERLFNLEISKYPQLVEMEENNKKYDEVYNVFDDFSKRVAEFGTTTWNKLDIKNLMETAEKYVKDIRKMVAKKPVLESMPPFMQLNERISSFKESLPLIEQLNHPAIQDRHWMRIIEETGQESGEINTKTLSLNKVFELDLGKHEEVVTAICVEAKAELKNEEQMLKIESEWKNEQFEMLDYVKNGQVVCYTIKTPDEIRQKLEDCTLILQSLAASKYVRAIKKRVETWDRDLNRINEVIELWMIVQRKWQYLERIFSFDDIKMQLPDEAKKFGKTDTNYKKIMENAYKNKIVHFNCVRADNGARFDDLKNISFELDKCQRSLQNYLDSKQNSFPRFYFISNDDLLQILGSSDPTSIQRFMLSLFDNCKKLNFVNNNKIIEGMTSDEGESYDFVFKVKPEGKIEEWMNIIDDEMKNSLLLISKQAVWEYARMKRIEWIQKQIGMVALVGT
jgi:dynein heavy chain